MPIASTQAWNEAASTIDTQERMLATAEFIHSSFIQNGVQVPIRIVNNTEDLPFRVEVGAQFNSGQRVNFQSIPFQVDFPRLSNLGVEAPISIDNIGREIAHYLEAATKVNEPIQVILRGFLLSDPDTVGHGPFRLRLRSVTRQGSKLDGSLTISDPTKLRVMREIYDALRFPALLTTASV